MTRFILLAIVAVAYGLINPRVRKAAGAHPTKAGLWFYDAPGIVLGFLIALIVR